MYRKKGFTIIEICVVALFSALLLILFFIQKSNVDAMRRDDDRKTAINAIYYALEESFYTEHHYYPEVISEENITVIDPALWTDPSGFNLNDSFGSYFYEPSSCSEGKCQRYVLRATMEKEDSYIKTNRLRDN